LNGDAGAVAYEIPNGLSEYRRIPSISTEQPGKEMRVLSQRIPFFGMASFESFPALRG